MTHGALGKDPRLSCVKNDARYRCKILRSRRSITIPLELRLPATDGCNRTPDWFPVANIRKCSA